MPITAELDRELRTWLSHYSAVMCPDGQPLPWDWTLVPPAHWQADNVWLPRGPGRVVYMVHRRYSHPELIVQAALAALGYDTKGEGFHTLRRSAARLVLNRAATEGVDNPIRIAQAVLGHQAQATTERYLGVFPDREARDRLLKGRCLFSEEGPIVDVASSASVGSRKSVLQERDK